MSTQPQITDDGMQYFQFKARQLYLLQKEDHEWNEFCKRKTCTCSSCQPLTNSKPSKEVAVQASSRNVPSSRPAPYSSLNRGLALGSGLQNRHLPETLNEIKTKLDRIDHALSEMHLPLNDERIATQQVPNLQFPATVSTDGSGRNTLNDKRMQIIQNSLKASVQRLQSAAMRGTSVPSVNVKTKNRGFFLPHDLQRQRAIARKNYLASLSKLENKASISNPPPRTVGASKKDTSKQGKKSLKTLAKPRKKLNGKEKVEENIESDVTTCVQSSEIKDENIENAVDGILDDLLGETVLAVNKIKQIKSGKYLKLEKSHECKLAWLPQNRDYHQDTNVPLHLEQKKETSDQQSHWEKLRQNLINVKNRFEQKSDINYDGTAATEFRDSSNMDCGPKIQKNCELNEQNAPPCASGVNSHNTVSKTIEVCASSPVKRKKLFIDPKAVNETSKHRRQFWKYLEQISRTKKGNFNPWTLSNMVAESILDDCLVDVCQELQDVPSSLITELYDQEFLQDF